MTRKACGNTMRTSEREMSGAVLKVGCSLPRTDVVTRFAIAACRRAQIMRISMTCSTTRIGKRITHCPDGRVIDMAIRTCNRRMRTRECEARVAMPCQRKRGGFESIDRMARVAAVCKLCGQLAGMRVFVAPAARIKLWVIVRGQSLWLMALGARNG